MWCSGWKTHGHWPFCPASRTTRPEITPISTKSRGPASCLRHTPSPEAPLPVWGKKVRRRPFHTPFVLPAGKSTSQRGLPTSIIIHGSSKQCRRKQCYPKPRGFHSRFPKTIKSSKRRNSFQVRLQKSKRGKKPIGQFLLAFTLGDYQKRKKTKQGSLSAKRRRRAGSIESIIICAATPKSVLIRAAWINISGCRFCDLIDDG